MCPRAEKCAYSIQSTLLESIETLKMLGLDDLFNKSVEAVKRDFRCRNLGWVNRHELWSRVIGSLIGSYFVTHDYFFLEQAEECASLSLRCEGINKLPSGFVNLKNQTRKPLIWTNGTALSDVGGGLPELLALYHLTGNRTYYRLYDRTIRHVSKMRSAWTFLTNRRGQRASDMAGLDALTMSFYRNAAFSDRLLGTPYSARILESARSMPRIFGNISQYFSLLDARGALPFRGLETLAADAAIHYSADGALFRPGDDSNNGGLRFNGAPLRGLIWRCWEAGDASARVAVAQAIRMVISACQMEFGFSGIKHSNLNQFKFDGVQHTAFISEWMKAGAMLDPAFESLAKSAVFNERGHLLDWKEVHDNQPLYE